MPRPPRCDQFSPEQISYCHLIQRCVRRAYLAGLDPVSGKNYDFRRQWIRTRMERLASVFGIDLLAYAILSNHMHLVVRTRPDVVESWSDKEVSLRWLRLFPGRRLDEQLGEPTTADVDALASDTSKIKEIRSRLSNPSWFMKALCEPIARLANRQDEVTGHFWEGRFKAIALIDEAALLACSMYVDLNPIQAAMAETIEKSVHSSGYDRYHASRGATIPSAAAELVAMDTEQAGKIIRNSTPEELQTRRQKSRYRRGPSIAQDAWLAPIPLGLSNEGLQTSKTGVRASDRGFLSLDWAEYFKLLVWTAKSRSRTSDSSKIPNDLAPILNRVGIDGGMLCELVWGFMKYFGRASAAGSPKSLKERASSLQRRFCPGQRSAAECFAH